MAKNTVRSMNLSKLSRFVGYKSSNSVLTSYRPLYHPTIIHSRPFIGTILSAISSPLDTLRQIEDTKKMIEKTRQELMDTYELSKIPRANTFAPLAGFCMRYKEVEYIRLALSTQPSFLVIFGGSSVGKTALIREVLAGTSKDSAVNRERKFIVMHIDLRIAGFSADDLTGLAIKLTTKFENFFEEVIEELDKDGIPEELLQDYKKIYENEFKGHTLAFKHLRKQFEARLEKVMEVSGSRKGTTDVGDISSIMERVQSALLAYWNFDPYKIKKKNDGDGDDTEKDNNALYTGYSGFPRRIPVIFLDEAHRLPALVDSEE